MKNAQYFISKTRKLKCRSNRARYYDNEIDKIIVCLIVCEIRMHTQPTDVIWIIRVT